MTTSSVNRNSIETANISHPSNEIPLIDVDDSLTIYIQDGRCLIIVFNN